MPGTRVDVKFRKVAHSVWIWIEAKFSDPNVTMLYYLGGPLSVQAATELEISQSLAINLVSVV